MQPVLSAIAVEQDDLHPYEAERTIRDLRNFDVQAVSALVPCALSLVNRLIISYEVLAGGQHEMAETAGGGGETERAGITTFRIRQTRPSCYYHT